MSSKEGVYVDHTGVIFEIAMLLRSDARGIELLDSGVQLSQSIPAAGKRNLRNEDQQ
jgi:hypothetical protein